MDCLLKYCLQLRVGLKTCFELVCFGGSDCSILSNCYIGRLCYSDYSQILLSCTNDNLRCFASQSNQSNIEHKQVPSQDCLSHLCSLFEKELDYHNDIESIKQELCECENFDINNLFDSLDFSKQGFLDFSSIQKFLIDNKFKATESDVNSILRRMDLTANAQISLAEFIEGTKYIRPKATSNLEKVTASTPNGYLTSLRKKTIFNNFKLMNEGFCKENKYEYQADASIVAQERREISIKSSYLCYKKDSKLLEPTQSTPNRSPLNLSTSDQNIFYFDLSQDPFKDSSTCKNQKTNLSIQDSVQPPKYISPTRQKYLEKEQNVQTKYEGDAIHKSSYPYYQGSCCNGRVTQSNCSTYNKNQSFEKNPITNNYRNIGASISALEIKPYTSDLASTNFDFSKDSYENSLKSAVESDKSPTRNRSPNLASSSSNSNSRAHFYADYQKSNGRKSSYYSYSNEATSYQGKYSGS